MSEYYHTNLIKIINGDLNWNNKPTCTVCGSHLNEEHETKYNPITGNYDYYCLECFYLRSHDNTKTVKKYK